MHIGKFKATYSNISTHVDYQITSTFKMLALQKLEKELGESDGLFQSRPDTGTGITRDTRKEACLFYLIHLERAIQQESK